MLSTPFDRAALFGRRVRGDQSTAWLAGLLSAFSTVGLILLLGLVVGLLATGGSLRVPIADEPKVAAWAGPPTTRTETAVEYERHGLLPLAYRLDGTWHGAILRSAYESVPWLRSSETCLLMLLFAGLILAASRALGEFLLARWSQQAAERTASSMRAEVQKQAQRLGGAALIEPPTPSVLELFRDRVEIVRRALAAWWRVVPLACLQSGGCALLALAIEPWLALAAILLAALAWFLWVTFERRAQDPQRLLSDQVNRQFADLESHLTKSHLLGGCMLDNPPGQPFEQSLARYHQFAQRRNTVSVAGRPLVHFALMAGVIIIAALAGVNTLRTPPRLTLAETTVLFAALWAAWTPLREILRLRTGAADSDRAAAELFAYLDREPRVGQMPKARAIKPVTRDIQLVHVTLADHAGKRLLDDVSLRIAAGTRVAVIASDERTPLTLSGLLPRCYDPAAGKVLFDGHDIRHATLESLRRETSLVSPTGLLRNVSVADNISWGDPKFAPRHITRGAKWAQAYSFIQRLPQGFSTILDDDNHRLSPSEALRISLARAHLHEPSIIVLEEPLDELDAETIELLDEAIQKISKDRTLVTVSPRLNTLRRADRVFLLHDGRLFAEGTHAELLQSCDLYRHLLYLQFNEFRASMPHGQAEAVESPFEE